MEKEVLRRIIADQCQYQAPQDFFLRTQVNHIKAFVDDPSIIIISGLRRSGKSTIQRVLQRGACASDFYFNFDDERLIHFSVDDFQKLLEVFYEIFGKGSTFYFDEIQNIIGWERFVRRLSESGNKVFVTGSNATLLSKELGTHLTGRYIRFEVFPLSYREIAMSRYPEVLEKKVLTSEDQGILQGLFREYFDYGGIPDFFKFRKVEYLKDLYEGILYRDIVARYKVSKEKVLRELVYYLASNIGKEFSFSKLSKLLGLSSPGTTSSYCSYLEQTYLCFFVNRYSHSLQKQLQYNKKCYMIDPAIIRNVGFRVSEDRGRLLENIAFLHLRMKGKEIYFHKGQKECDFVLREGNQITEAIQVAVHLSEEKLRRREISGLKEAMETYKLKEGLILTEDEESSFEEDGLPIKVLPMWKWLLAD